MDEERLNRDLTELRRLIEKAEAERQAMRANLARCRLYLRMLNETKHRVWNASSGLRRR
jgi:hypothetical protein